MDVEVFSRRTMESAVLHLKPVFDACDQNGDGFVKTQDLLLLSQEHTTDGFEVGRSSDYVESSLSCGSVSFV